jgi:hypothetical protein
MDNIQNATILDFIGLNTYVHACIHKYVYNMSHGSTVGIATGYRLDDQGVGVRVPIASRILTCSYCPDRFLGPPNLLSIGYQEFFLWRIKWQKCAADHSPPTSAVVTKMRIYTSTPPYVFLA